MQNQDAQDRMFQFIKAWQQSGVSQKSFCEQSGIRYHVFHYWFKRFRGTGSGSTDTKFIPLHVNPLSSSDAAPCIELMLADGRRLFFHQPVSAEFIKTVIG